MPNARTRNVYLFGLLLAFAYAAADELSAPPTGNTEPKIDTDQNTSLTSRLVPGALGNSYQPPTINPKKFKDGIFPMKYPAVDHSGWVMVNMMVNPQGEPYAIGIVESNDPALDKAALDTASALRFTPGSLNGEPVDSAYSMKIRFSTRAGATKQFIRQYRQLEEGVQNDDKTAADEALKKLKFQSLYEEALYYWGRFHYCRHWGSEQQQLDALQKAIAYERSAKYLPAEYFQAALVEIFRLQTKTKDFGGALETYEAFEPERKSDPAIVSAVEQIKTLSTNTEVYSVRGEIPKNRSWNFRLLKRQFTLLVSQGKIEEFKLRCEAKYVLVRYKPDFDYTLPQDYGACHLEVIGDSGTTFALIQS